MEPVAENGADWVNSNCRTLSFPAQAGMTGLAGAGEVQICTQAIYGRRCQPPYRHCKLRSSEEIRNYKLRVTNYR